MCFFLQFRSLSDQIYGTSDYHDVVREEIVHQLKSKPELYANFVPMAYGDYLKKMSRNGGWGDNCTLQAAADSVRSLIIPSLSYHEHHIYSYLNERCFVAVWRKDLCGYFIQRHMLH